MPLVEVGIPHFLSGVSQQPPAGRQPGQVTACDNALLHPINGLTKRPGTRHLAKLIVGLESVRLAHWINRDTVERYLVLLGERRVRVFDAEAGTEFPVKVNGTATNAGRGRASTGTPINYLDPRTPTGVVDQDEDFVIGAGDWLSVAANSVTAYIAGRGPFKFGRRESLTTVTRDSVAEVGNGAAATVSDIYQDFGLFSQVNTFSVFVKKGNTTANDVELAFVNGGDSLTVRFDISVGGVVTVGAQGGTYAIWGAAGVEAFDDGWYRCTVQLSRLQTDQLLGIVGVTRRIRVRFHTNAAGPANQHVLLFGARVHDHPEIGLVADQPLNAVPDYIHERTDLFKALTIADSTLLLNTETTVAATDGTSTSGGGGGIRAFVYVKQAIVTTIYKLTFRSTVSVTTTASYTSVAGDDTADIVTGLIGAITAIGGTPYVAGSNIGSTFLVSAFNSELGAITASDGGGNNLMIAVMAAGGTVPRLTDLPTELGSNSMVLKVAGQAEDPRDDYYVRPVFRNSFSTSDVFWQETLGPAIPFQLREETLPQTLSRRQDNAAGTITGIPNAVYFDVSATAWDNRLVGDSVSNPDPGFVGLPINDLFLFRGRLGFLARATMILSEAGEIFNFWRTTVRSLPDTDPIELGSITHQDELLTAAATADLLLVSSDRRQFQLIAEPTLTPATAQLTPLRAFDLLAVARPATTGRGVMFARLDGGNTGLVEASLTGDDQTLRFEELTLHVPRYLAGSALEIAHSSLTGLSVVRADDPEIVYLHQSLLNAQEERVQSAVHRWTFHADTLVRGLAFFSEVLKQVVERAEGWFLEEQPTGTEITEGALPITHLDRRLTEAQLTRVYNGGTDETTITLPYAIPTGATVQVVDAATGLLVPVVSSTTTTLVVSGDHTASALFVGERFDLAVTMTQPVVQDDTRSGFLLPRLSHPVNVHALTLYLADTAILRVEIARSLRTPTAEEFSAAGLGTGLLGMGQLNLYTGPAVFGVLALSTELTCTLKNITPFPSRVQAGRWEVRQHARASAV